MIRIAIDGGDFTPTMPVKSGINRVISEYVRRTAKTKQQSVNVYGFHSSLVGRLPTAGFSEFFLPLKSFFDRREVFLAFSSHIPFFIRKSNIKKILFVYDLGFIKFPEYYKNPKQMKNRMETGLLAADVIVVPTSYTKIDLLQEYPHMENKNIRVLPFGVDHLNDSTKKSLVPFPYYLFVGVTKPIKNIERLLRIFLKLTEGLKDKDSKLILIGRYEKDYAGKLKEKSLYKQLRSRIIHLSSIQDGELSLYYQHAKALINVSHEEGFAFPVLEAARFGTPVVVSDLPLYREYTPFFPSIKIGKTDQEIIELLKKSRRTNTQTPRIFTWENFTTELQKIISLVYESNKQKH